MHLVLKLSKLCNLRCRYCYEHEDLANKERMPLDGLKFFMQHLGEHYREQEWRHELRFVLHGGEPSLLPGDYLRGFVDLQKHYLDGIPYSNSLQTNLYRLNERQMALMEELCIGMGVSLDVFGGERRTLADTDSQASVLANLQKLIDRGRIERLGVGAISVLHRGNVERAEGMLRFYNELGLNFRFLPIFSVADPPERMRDLMLSHEALVDALRRVTVTYFEIGSSISVYPIYNYFTAAVRYLAGVASPVYAPGAGEWALIVDTNGDAYNNGEAYLPEGRMGNVFADTMCTILASPARRALTALRDERARTCDACPYGATCSRLPLVEALPSERAYDDAGRLCCPVARPMIDFMVELIRNSSEAMARVSRIVEAGVAVEPSL